MKEHTMNVSAHVDVVMADSAPVESPLTVETSEPPTEAEPDSTEHAHKPVQHRDGKEPWCKTCGLNNDGQEPSKRRTTND